MSKKEMNFSERMGIIKPQNIIQVDSIDRSLRNRLWNILYAYIFDQMESESNYTSATSFFKLIGKIWNSYLKEPLDEIPIRATETSKYVKEFFFSSNWYNVYNFIEFICNNIEIDLKTKFNIVLEEELSAYRFVGNEIVQITDKPEIEEIEQALKMTQYNSLEGVRDHVSSSLQKLSQKETPDYRNSIKESISAVESLVKLLTKKKKSNLNEALLVLKKEVQIHPALEKGFRNIYGYTSDEGGIRHAMLEKDNIGFEDAKYMLVSCSAFINYLIIKAEKAGLLNNEK